MRIVFYIDPFIYPRPTFYILDSLRNEINTNPKYRDHQFDIYVRENGNLRNNNDCYVDLKYANEMKYNVLHGQPKADDYEILLVMHIYNFHMGSDQRVKLATEFLGKGKQVICIKTDTTFECRELIFPKDKQKEFKGKIKYLITSNYRLELSNKWVISSENYNNSAVIPQLGNLSMPKDSKHHKVLTKHEFCKKYKLDKDKKIMIFFLGAYKKWYHAEFCDNRTIMWFFKNLTKIYKILDTLGYQLIFKLHRVDGPNIMERFKRDHIKLTAIDPRDTYEAIKYSHRALSYLTTMVYELYLYDLPVMELGGGVYYPGWLNDMKFALRYAKRSDNVEKNTNAVLKPPYGKEGNKKFAGGKNLIYGKLGNFIELKTKPEKVFKNFVGTHYKIEDFKYQKKNPIHGNSYGSMVVDIADALITNIC